MGGAVGCGVVRWAGGVRARLCGLSLCCCSVVLVEYVARVARVAKTGRSGEGPKRGGYGKWVKVERVSSEHEADMYLVYPVWSRSLPVKCYYPTIQLHCLRCQLPRHEAACARYTCPYPATYVHIPHTFDFVVYSCCSTCTSTTTTTPVTSLPLHPFHPSIPGSPYNLHNPLLSSPQLLPLLPHRVAPTDCTLPSHTPRSVQRPRGRPQTLASFLTKTSFVLSFRS